MREKVDATVSLDLSVLRTKADRWMLAALGFSGLFAVGIGAWRGQAGLAIKEGDSVEIVQDPSNEFDSGAISVHWRGSKLGYINRAMCATVGQWLGSGQLTVTVERVNGRPERPLVYLRMRAG